MSAPAVFAWISQHSLYLFGAILGLSLGIFYGFDGWKGSVDDLDFKDSPRAKNLIWLLTGAFTAVIGDIEHWDKHASRPLLVLVYCGAALAGAALVVLIWGFVVLCDSLLIRRRLGSAFSPLDALGDYFFFGYRKYRQRKAEISAGPSLFHSKYLTQLTYLITAAGTAKSSSTDRLTVIRSILRSMATVVRDYRGDSSTATIHASLMQVVPFSDSLARRCSFAADASSVQNFLHLIAYDADDQANGLVLPLPNLTTEKPLPGAPTAHLEGFDLLDDTRKIVFPEGIASEVRQQMTGYFERVASPCSFASLRVVSRGQPIAVVNIDSSETCVFGKDEAGRKDIVQHLLPFCAALGVILSSAEDQPL